MLRESKDSMGGIPSSGGVGEEVINAKWVLGYAVEDYSVTCVHCHKDRFVLF